ncbi:MAG: hypothetical protein ACJ72A_07120 [Nocardioidaceae bacterium]
MLSDLFGTDPLANQRQWLRFEGNPVIAPEGTGWAEDFIAACSVVERDGELRLYAEGSVGGHEQVGLFTADGRDPAVWSEHDANPIVRVDTGRDAGGVFDPAVVEIADRSFLYYSATEGDAHAFAEQLEHGVSEGQPTDESIGLAVSEDGVTFAKHPDAPVLQARCPFAVVHDGTVYLFHVRITAGGYRVHLATSDDGVKFETLDEAVLEVGQPGTWDSLTVTTPKVFGDGERWCMSYAGDSDRLDDPRGIGLAYSDDLRSWEKVAGNPVFATGDAGSFDSASIQSPIIRRFGERYYMWYAGSDRLIRDGLHSQVGLAWIPEASDS